MAGRRGMTVVGEKLGPEREESFLDEDDKKMSDHELEEQGRRADTEPPAAKAKASPKETGPLDVEDCYRRCALNFARATEADQRRVLAMLNARYGA